MPEDRPPAAHAQAEDLDTRRGEGRVRGRNSGLLYAAPALLVLVALVQAFLAQTQDLTPWKGGGFAMFASPDRSEHRAVRVYLQTPDGEVPAAIPAGGSGVSDRAVLRARNLPTQGALLTLAGQLGDQEWVTADGAGPRTAVSRASLTRPPAMAAGGSGGDSGDTGDDVGDGGAGGDGQRVRSSGTRDTANEQAEAPALDVQAVRLEVWRLGVDRRDGLEIVPTRLADITRSVR